MELVDVADSKSAAARRAGSSPASGTTKHRQTALSDEGRFVLWRDAATAPALCRPAPVHPLHSPRRNINALCGAANLFRYARNRPNTRFTFSFKHQPAGCRYRIITITRDGGRDDSTGWQVTGYGQEHSYLADKANGYTSDAPDIMSCYLIREQNKT